MVSSLSMMSSTISTALPCMSSCGSLRIVTTPEEYFSVPYEETWMKSSAASMLMARIKSLQKNMAPLRTQQTMSSEPAKSAEICRPMAETRSSIRALLINVVCGMQRRILAAFPLIRDHMSVVDIGVLHGRYVRLTDRFKAVWTYHQFASAVFKNFLGTPLPYAVDFQSTYDRIKAVSATLNAAQARDAAANMDLCDLALERASDPLLRVDDQITAPIARRFFEKLKKQDESIVQNLIKFYFYADAVEGDRRDKLDYLFTRIGEDFIADRGEYWSRDSLEFRERIIALVSLMRVEETPQEEVVRVILAVRALRDQIQSAQRFEDLTQKNLLKNARQFKHRLGDFYFHPDVLLSIVELNVATKNKFLRLYHEDEKRIVEDSQKLLEHGAAIERNFGDTNPELLQEIARFRSAKEQFDRSRASSNVKHNTITQLKQSMTNILAQLDRGLGVDEEETTADLPPAFFTEAEQAERITGRFGRDLLQPYLARIAAVVDTIEPLLMPEEAALMPAPRELRLEPGEIAACAD